jgi:hypothetical protein
MMSASGFAITAFRNSKFVSLLPPAMLLRLLPLSLTLWHISVPVHASLAGSFADGGNTQVSAMMVCSTRLIVEPPYNSWQMFVGNSKKVYILDKAEGNEAQVNGHPAWGAVW